MTTVVITGASRGIGRACALAFAERGCELALLGRPSERQAATASACAELVGAEAVADIACDVADESSIVAAARAVMDRFGAPDVVLNNAAVLLRGPSLWETSTEDWDRTMSTNVRGPFLLNRAFLPSMIARGSGRLLQLSSVSGTIGCPQQGAYGTSKWALLGYHAALTDELRGTGLQTFALLPGSVDTDMLKQTPFPPDMPPADVAAVAVYAGLDAPSSMHGARLEIYG